MYTWLFDNGWNYPLYSSGFLSFGMFLVSLCYMIRKLLVYKELDKQICFIPLTQNLALSFLNAAYLMCMAYSLYQSDMSTSRYLILALAADLIWICLFSHLIMKRTFTTGHLLAVLIAVFGYVLYDMIRYEGIQKFSIRITSDNWKGPTFCVLARMFAVLCGVCSKRILLRKGYQDKV